MAKVFIEETTLTAIGDAIRGKTGKTELIDPANMSTEIAGIEAGGGGSVDIPEEAFKITGDCAYKFSGNGWAWFIDLYGDKITTENITSMSNMFYQTGISEIPFQLNISDNCMKFEKTFYYTQNLAVCPKIRGNIPWTSSSAYSISFDDCADMASKLRDIEDLFTPEMIRGFSGYLCTNAYLFPYVFKCYSMQSLRRVPSWWREFKLNPESTAFPTSSTAQPYREAFTNCYALDEVIDIPVWACKAASTGDMFYQTFKGCWRLGRVTFETNSDGSPIEAMWKNQTIDLAGATYNGVGHGYDSWAASNLTNERLNTGITLDKAVTDDASYQALKNDPDWFTDKVAYSRYNHDSAVGTINSLPDTSAYLATAGGTNTIKFTGAAGSLTDGGAINTLTAEEIAVATAKGWTVTLS